MSNAKSLAAVLILSVFSAAVCKAGQLETSSAGAGKDFSAFTLTGSVQAASIGNKIVFDQPRPAPFAAEPSLNKALELYCSVGKLQLTPKGGVRYNAIVNDAAMTKSLRETASKLPGGPQSLVNVSFINDTSFMVVDFQKEDGTGNYDAGQFAPKLRLLGGGRAVMVLTYFHMTGSHSYDYNEVVSLGFSGCIK